LDFDNFLKFDERVRAVSAEDIRSAYAYLLQHNPPVVAVVGPQDSWKPENNTLLWNS
jgi:predicted Zn-dependent peptidase